MVFCPHCAHDSYSWSLSNPSSLLPSRLHPLIILFSFLSVLSGVQGRRGPFFDTVSFSDLTPCNPVTFSWTGGIAPFSLFIVNDDTENTVQEFDSIEDDIFVWTPPQRAVGRVLFAAVIDEDGNGDEDDTDNFVVQSALCSSSVSSSLSTSSATTVIPTVIPPTTINPSSQSAHTVTGHPNSPPPLPSSPLPSSSSTLATTTSLPSSASSQSLPITTAVPAQPSSSNNNTSTSDLTTGTPSSPDGSTSSPTFSLTISAEQSASSRPHRKSTTSAGEIAGIVLGAVAILAMLVGLVTWWWLIRRRTRDRAREPDDDKYTALNSSRSTQHEPSLSRPRSIGSKAAIRRHAYSGVSPTTTAAPTSLFHGGSEGDVDGAAEWGHTVLHVHAGRTAANSLSVEPPTPQPFQGFDFGFDQRRGRPQPGVLSPLSVLPPPRLMMKAIGGEAGARGDGRTTAVAADSPAAATVGARQGTESRVGSRETRPPPREVDPDAKLAEERNRGVGGEVRSAVVRARTRLTIIESDAGVRLAGGPPGLPLLSLDTDSAAITTLPPPYRHYDSSSVS